MAAGRAWVLNLDADVELAAGPRYAPTRAVLDAMRPHVARLASSLLGPDDVLVDDASPAGFARGRVGRAFCPTTRACSLLERAGATVEPHPTMDVLRRVNARAFAAGLGQTLPGATFATDVDAAVRSLADAPKVGEAWRAKRNFGMAGRGQRVVAPGAVSTAERAFLDAAMREGGLQIEPNVTIERELAMHGFVDRDGAFELGAPVTQRCDARGQWLATERLEVRDASSSRVWIERLGAEAAFVADALCAAGYFGPFGVDAFVYRSGSALAFQPRSEINARYSMGFAVGFARGVHDH